MPCGVARTHRASCRDSYESNLRFPTVSFLTPSIALIYRRTASWSNSSEPLLGPQWPFWTRFFPGWRGRRVAAASMVVPRIQFEAAARLGMWEDFDPNLFDALCVCLQVWKLLYNILGQAKQRAGCLLCLFVPSASLRDARIVCPCSLCSAFDAFCCLVVGYIRAIQWRFLSSELVAWVGRVNCGALIHFFHLRK